MDTKRLDGMQYYLFPSLNPGRAWLSHHDKAFALWCDTWKEVLNGLGCDATHLEEEWGRQDRIACIFEKDTPVAVHLYSFFTLGCAAATKHPYFKNYTPEFFEKLRDLGVESVMSMEYMTIHPEWRRHTAGFHLGAVLGGLALKVMNQNGLEAAIAPARRDHQVHKLAYIYGGDCIVENVTNHNVACDLIACRHDKIHDHPDETVRRLVSSLWRNRVIGVPEPNRGSSQAA